MKLQVIGRGLFTTAYQSPNDRNKVVLKSRDPVKECMAIGQFPDSKLFPKVRRRKCDDSDAVKTYEMKKYPKCTAPKQQLNKKHYEIYKALRTLGLYHPSSKAARNLKIPRYVKEALQDAYNVVSNYGLPRFEISPRNISYTPSGRLILLDCFYIYEEAERVHNEWYMKQCGIRGVMLKCIQRNKIKEL